LSFDFYRDTFWYNRQQVGVLRRKKKDGRRKTEEERRKKKDGRRKTEVQSEK
jgi:hypothetical protein